MFGSIYTLAPEQIDGTKPSVRSDLYSLGCLYYYAACGKWPHAGNSVQEVAIDGGPTQTVSVPFINVGNVDAGANLTLVNSSVVTSTGSALDTVLNGGQGGNIILKGAQVSLTNTNVNSGSTGYGNEPR